MISFNQSNATHNTSKERAIKTAQKTNEEVVQEWIDSPDHVTHRASEILEEIGWERGQQTTVTAWGIEFEKVMLPDGRHIVVEHERYV